MTKSVNDIFSKTKLSCIKSLSDKIANIISMFLLDKKPNCSKGTFGVCRQTNGIFNILEHLNIIKYIKFNQFSYFTF